MEEAIRRLLPDEYFSISKLWNEGMYYSYEAMFNRLHSKIQAIFTTEIYQELLALDEALTLRELQHYTCGVDGRCKRSWGGKFNTLEECEAGTYEEEDDNDQVVQRGKPCTAINNVEVFYEIMKSLPEQALELPASEQRELVRRLLDFPVPTSIARRVLEALSENEWSELWKTPALRSWLECTYSFSERLGRNLATALGITSLVPVDYNALAERFVELIREDEDLMNGLKQFFLGVPVQQEDPADNDLGEDSWDLIMKMVRIVIQKFMLRGDNVSQRLHDQFYTFDLLGEEMAALLDLEYRS